jgi:hypothetical protein
MKIHATASKVQELVFARVFVQELSLPECV